MIAASAPGKLFIIGEYAVVDSGEPAVLVAVDRYLHVRLHPQEAAHPACPSPQSDHVREAIRAVDELRHARGLAERHFSIEIESELDEADGRKYGLGSSAAVTVATIDALNQLYNLNLSALLRFRLALLATIEVSPRASGGDLAASTFGGWVRYTSPDRAQLSAQRNQHGICFALESDAWLPCTITQLHAPSDLKLLVGWSGSPASTDDLVNEATRAAQTEHIATQQVAFLAESRALVDTFTAALTGSAAGTDGTFAAPEIRAIRDARALLKRLGEDRGIVIETPTLRELCDIAEHHGAAAKPSGAGGGDCAIALATPDTDIESILREWQQHSITPLDLKVHTSVVAEAHASAHAHASMHATTLPRTPSPTPSPTYRTDIEQTEPQMHTESAAVRAARKDDHVALASAQRTQHTSGRDFDDVEFLHHALDGIDVADVSLTTHVHDWQWAAPFYINGMTGGTEQTAIINRELAITARETRLPMACGSVSIALDAPHDHTIQRGFAVIREENPDGFVMANIGVGRPAVDAVRAVELLQADALQVHINAVQELAMPEGSRNFSSWQHSLEAIIAASPVPVIVKEVGFGLSARTLTRISELGAPIADVSGTGGTDFLRIENARRTDKQGSYAMLAGFGQSAMNCLLDAPADAPELLASGGVRNPFDVVKALAAGAKAVGVAGTFLEAVRSGGAEELIALVGKWHAQTTAILALLGAATPAQLTSTDMLIRGRLAEYCQLRGIDTAGYARRSSHIGNAAPTRPATIDTRSHTR